MAVSGFVTPEFQQVLSAFAEGQKNDAGGAQLAVYHKGVKVVDIWTGNDPVRQRPFDGEGYVMFMSSTKGLTAIAAHVLVQRGLLDINAPVSKYWPEFAQNGKENITVSMLLSHTAGLGAVPAECEMKMPDLADWNKNTHWLEEMAPLWEPGTKLMYHPVTFGFLVGEVVRRISGKTVGTFLREEIAKPCGLDLWIGLPAELEPCVIPMMKKTLPQSAGSAARAGPPILPAGGTQLDSSESAIMGAYKIVFDFDGLTAFLDTPRAHEAEIPAANGIGDVRIIAKLYAHVIGDVDGKPRILSEEIVKAASVPQTDGLEVPSPFSKIMPSTMFRFALGFEKPRPAVPMLGESSFGHSGAGGRLAFADIDSGLAVGYLCNNPTWEPPNGPDPRWVPWLKALKDIVKQ
ncbi:beta-lactamase/transpeptidase-like protein [Dacryopinax primogenitus]|uniref:Beta-lactamase/transpeptidase-like protein n=1 Tax=Dacryopinax primogenitus (strain DJM 731) TaxID=1858805 RepID=M5G0Q3_DACPD|nr:beta-lactamase/transpeptidase-like protein [Dacryopinax primogenitus]EJT97382.1 beta-lactamase/transpeptidase-like protein [Dacryopinax primogenitus]